MKIAYANLLWICFSLLGLIILGIIPSTVALFAVIRKWLMSDNDVPVFKTFFTTYKAEFLKSNLIGYLMVMIAFVIYYDFIYVSGIQGVIQMAMSVPLIILTIFYLVTILNLLPVYVHYDLKFFQYIKHSFYIGIANPFLTLSMAVGCLLIGLLLKFIPGLLPFFCPSLFAIVMMWVGLRSFRNIEAKQKGYELTL